MVNFQNLKKIIIRVNQKEINVKNNLKQTKWHFYFRKNWNKSYQNFQPKCIGSGIQNIGKANKLLFIMTVCGHGFHNGVMAYMLQFG